MSTITITYVWYKEDQARSFKQKGTHVPRRDELVQVPNYSGIVQSVRWWIQPRCKQEVTVYLR